MPKNLLLLFIMCALTGSFFSCTSEENAAIDNTQLEEIPLEASIVLNVSYGSHPEQVYDLYLPQGRTSEVTKTILLIHGGGWTSGDKADMTNFVDLIQLQHPNHAIVNINYELASLTPPYKTAFPNQFLDIKTVINKITSERESLQILPEFGIIGASAGAHIALMYDFVYDTTNQVKFVADIVGPTNFIDPFFTENSNFEQALEILVDEDQYPSGTNYAEATSPLYQVSNLSSPAVMFYGNEDPLVPLTNGTALEQALSNAQITHSFTVYVGGHGDDWSKQDLFNLQLQISDYVNTYLAIL